MYTLIFKRKVIIELTYPGKSLQNKAKHIPEKIREFFNTWDDKELIQLKVLMERLIGDLNKS